MYTWWWAWLPGLRKKWKLEKRRIKALSFIEAERLGVEQMAQRPRQVSIDDQFNQELFDDILKRLRAIEEEARTALQYDRLGDLMDDAEQQGQFRGDLCPVLEIVNEGTLVIDLIEEWGVPQSIIKKLRDSLGEDLKKRPAEARPALRLLFKEKDSWFEYTDDYEETMERYTFWLFLLTLLLPLLAVTAFHFAFRFHPLVVVGLLCSSVAGSCVSVMRKMPGLEVSLSKELGAYARRIWSRIGFGVATSMIGCALLGWGMIPLSFQGQTFTDALSASTTACAMSSASACAVTKNLILLGVAMLLGFSERALTTLEQRVFGNLKRSEKG